MTDKEKEFYSKPFNFSYSSLKKLLAIPKSFYKEKILQDKEDKTAKHLIEGRLIHCLNFEKDKVNEKFKIIPENVPSDSVLKILRQLSMITEAESLDDVADDVILDTLKEFNLYQSYKEDSKRLEKIKTKASKTYYDFLKSDKDVVDFDTYQKCLNRVDLIFCNQKVIDLLEDASDSEFPLPTDSIVEVEKYLQMDLKEYNFGLHGYLDRL
ncbi:MAG: hypothetical protein HRT87_06960, partial [Legionellales bacterium]|nr:hypothetical protein [Legionellales bacterium]